MPDDLSLLRGFVEQGSERDFAQLVERHLGLVYTTAVRRVGGDAHLAEDVTQSVFIDLARKARALLHHRVLAGWLYTSTLYAAAKAVRGEQRRRQREEQAHTMHELHADESAHDAEWARVRPVLDDALRALPARDREAILLRYFQAEGFATIGASLKVSENGARMRVDRALDKLRAQLAQRGIASTLTALGTALSANAATIPPATLAATITTSALAGTSGASAAVVLFNIIAMTKVQLSLIAVVATVGITTVGVQQREQTALRKTIVPASASAIAGESAQIRAEIAHLQQTVADFQALQLQSHDLARIRREAADLRERGARLDPRVTAAAKPSPRPGGGADTPPATPPATLDQMPRPLQRVAPAYPAALQAAGIPGEVTLSFIVDSHGEVQDAKVIETTHPDFVAPALDAIRQWQFASGTKAGRSVNTRMQMPVIFAVDNPNWF